MTSRTNYYKSVSQIYRFHNIDGSKTGNQIPEEIYPFQTNIIDETSPYQDTESTTFDNSEIRLDSNIYTRIDIPEEDTIPEITENFEQTCTYHNKKANNNPISWGPPFWYTLHNGAYHYPEHAGPLHAERMKNFIIGIPIMVPCVTCKEHATAFIEKNRNKLNDICSSRDSLFKFFVDFHNKVNERYKKPILSYEEAYSIYNY
jgi:hypothetical protein